MLELATSTSVEDNSLIIHDSSRDGLSSRRQIIITTLTFTNHSQVKQDNIQILYLTRAIISWCA